MMADQQGESVAYSPLGGLGGHSAGQGCVHEHSGWHGYVDQGQLRAPESPLQGSCGHWMGTPRILLPAILAGATSVVTGPGPRVRVIRTVLAVVYPTVAETGQRSTVLFDPLSYPPDGAKPAP
jgi:hypothetical protein